MGLGRRPRSFLAIVERVVNGPHLNCDVNVGTHVWPYRGLHTT